MSSAAASGREDPDKNPDTNSANKLGIAKRKKILDKSVKKYVRQGYELQYKDDTAAQLRKPKKSRAGAVFVLTILTLGLWLLVEFLLFLIAPGWNKEHLVYLEIDEEGQITTTKA